MANNASKLVLVVSFIANKKIYTVSPVSLVPRLAFKQCLHDWRHFMHASSVQGCMARFAGRSDFATLNAAEVTTSNSLIQQDIPSSIDKHKIVSREVHRMGTRMSSKGTEAVALCSFLAIHQHL